MYYALGSQEMYKNKTVERYSFRGYKGFSFDNCTSLHLLWIDLVGNNLLTISDK